MLALRKSGEAILIRLNRKRNVVIVVFFATIFALIIIPAIKGNFAKNWLWSSEAIAQVYTDPAGFVKGTAYKNTYTLMSVPLNWTSALINEGIGAMLAENLTGANNPFDADQILKFHSDTQQYKTAWLLSYPGHPLDGKWIDPDTLEESTMTLAPGDAFWVRRRNTGNDTAEIVFLGWVPMAGYTDIVINTGWNHVAYSYPTPTAINDTSLKDDGAYGSTNAFDADNVLEWDPVTGTYRTAWLLDWPEHMYDDMWIDPNTLTPSDIIFSPTKGYWYNRRGGGSFTWHIIKPY